MAFRHLFRVNDLYTQRSFQFVNDLRYGKQMRQFRRGRSSEQPKQNLNNIEPPFHDVAVDVANLGSKSLWKPLIFTIGCSSACFVGAAIWEYETIRTHTIQTLKRPLRLFRKQSENFHNRSLSVLQTVKQGWENLTPGQRVFVPICAINVLVFAAWKVPRLHPFMLKYFCSNPARKNVCLPMVLSTFSHYSAIHLFANMYVLHSFSTGAVGSLGKEQFLGLYLGGGVISSFTSYVHKVFSKQAGSSLGASGAIMAILGYVCTQYPDIQLGIIFLPIFTFSAGAAIKAIIALDSAGVLMGWKFFDHAAHLGGAILGISWAMWGREIWATREPLQKYWHAIRGSP